MREPKVKLVGLTQFRKPDDVCWETDTDVDGQMLVEYAGRMCYQSWANPSGRSNEAYLTNLLEQGHLSVLEHSSATFSISGVSRSLTHELVRHRHLSFSQLSQRYVSEETAAMVLPPAIAEDPEAVAVWEEACKAAQDSYKKLYDLLRARYKHVEDRTLRRKMARQAARSVLPNCTETQIVVTGNFRAWRWFIHMRATEHADVEIRALAVAILKHLQREAPSVFKDFELLNLPDGTEAAQSKHPY
ncbi:MAG TPA: FAD-dependent thymidylate synthase [Armatimonadota bacterium]